jgi:integrase/recombinase XerD
VAHFVRIARKRLDYAGFLYVCQQARRKLSLHKPKKEHRLPQLLSESDLKRFFRVIQDCSDVQHEIMLKLLFCTAVRVSELVRIQVAEIDVDVCRISSIRAKAAKIATSYFPQASGWCSRGTCGPARGTVICSRPRHSGPFTPRREQQIVQKYRRRAGLDQHVHRHLFRHQMLSRLTAQGLTDSQIQLISGHESKRSLEVYQHLSLEQVERAYQAAVRDIDV